MKTRRHRLFAALLAVIALASVAGSRRFLHGAAAGSPSDHADTMPETEQPAPAAASAEHLAAGWTVGRRHVYDLSFAMAFGTASREAPADPGTGFELSGTLTTTVLVETPAGPELEIRLEPERIAPVGEPGGAAPAVRPGFAKALAAPFVAAFDRSGGVRELAFAGEVDGEARALLKELVAATQLVQPGAGAPPSWTAIERVPAGEVSADYAALGSGRFSRRRTHFVRIATAAGLVPPIPGLNEIASDAASLATGDDGRLVSLLARTNYVSRISGGAPRFETDVRIGLALVSRGDRPDMAAAGVARAVGERETMSTPAARFGDAERSRLTGVLAGGTLEGLLRDAADPAAIGDPRRRRALERRLGALMTLHPSVVPAVARALRAAADPGALVDALGESSAPTAQAALAAVAADRSLSVEARREAVAALATSPSVTRTTLAALEQGLQDPDVDKASAYALGAAVDRTLASDPEAAQEGLQRLRDRLDAATSETDSTQAIEALGNSGSPDVLSDLQGALGSSSPAVRAAAARALRLIPGSAVDQLLATTMTSDADPDVRVAALFSTGYRPWTAFLAPVTELCQHDPVLEVRQAAVFSAEGAANRGYGAGTAAVLNWVAQNDPDPALRSEAAGAVAARAD